MKLTTSKVARKGTFLAKAAGFTLLEILIAVACIALLVSMSIPAINNALTDTEATAEAGLASNIATAKSRYILDNGATAFDALNAGDAQVAAIGPYMQVSGAAPTALADLTPAGRNATITIGNSTTAPAVNFTD